MGRKPLPKSEVRRVISVSLKPATLEAIERMRGDTPRSQWVEQIVEHLMPSFMVKNIEDFQDYYVINCEDCQKQFIVNEKIEELRKYGYDDIYHCPKCFRELKTQLIENDGLME